MVGTVLRGLPRKSIAALALATLVAMAAGMAIAQSTYSVLVSTSPDRSSPVSLDAGTVTGSIYAFVSPETGISRVRFFVDDPAMSGAPFSTDTTAPYDLAGTGKKGTALAFDTTVLPDGPHGVTVSIELSVGVTEVVTSTFTVDNGTSPPPPPSTRSLMVSTSSDRSSPVALEGRTVAGTIYVFVSPESGISRVRFFVDDPTMSGLPFGTDTSAPWDLAGTAKGGSAKPDDTTQLPDGPHQVTASMDLSAGGTEVVTSSFTVSNVGPALTFTPGSLSFAVAAGGTDSQTLTLGTTGGTASFSVGDDAPWLAVSPASGSTPATLTATVDSAGLADGTYTATIGATAPGYAGAQAAVSLSVGSGALGADQVHLAWVEDPATTMNVVWRTLDATAPSSVQFRTIGTTTWQTVTGGPRPSGTAGALHEATLRSLTPSTTYEYRVAAGGGSWSQAFTTRTAPPSGPATFDVVYVADTGIAGRTDGLTTGSLQVIEEISNLDPLLVLLGGDYAYFDSDTRFATLDDAIDTWFNQMQPVGARSPMMVSYGNHEIRLGEGFEPWAARFPTPPGFDGRRTYSFDVGDVHFVSILAVTDNTGLSSSTLDWIEQDILAAQADGARWVIPFLHVSPFADGTVHPSNLQLRAQLGPLFESLGVQLVISSHDQSYERTYPLTDVPATNTPTSSSKTCYTENDGVTWVKVSPGGKLSNKNDGFSTFTTNPPPSWTAARDDTMHHFLRVRFSAEGWMRVEAFGVKGDGSPPVVQDSFTYMFGLCGKELALGAAGLSLSAPENGSPSVAQVTLDTVDGSSASYSVTDDAPWLSVQPALGTTPVVLNVAADPAGLPPGTYHATVTASAPGYAQVGLTVDFSVSGAFDLLVSSQPDRSIPVRLAGSTVSGNMYVFVGPEFGVTSVRFFVDDPSMAGPPFKNEKNAPWDLRGTAWNGLALPFDTTMLSNGSHSVTAAVDLTSGSTEVVTSTFTISNGGA